MWTSEDLNNRLDSERLTQMAWERNDELAGSRTLLIGDAASKTFNGRADSPLWHTLSDVRLAEEEEEEEAEDDEEDDEDDEEFEDDFEDEDFDDEDFDDEEFDDDEDDLDDDDEDKEEEAEAEEGDY